MGIFDFFKREQYIDVTWPDEEWKQKHTLNGHSYDAWKLEQKDAWLVFIYDQMMENHRSHYLIKGYGEKIANVFTQADNWTLWKRNVGPGTYPIALKNHFTGIQQGRIKGELWLIKSYRILELDEFKCNGVEFRRRKVPVLLPYRHVRNFVNKEHYYDHEYHDFVVKYDVWMYTGRQSYWAEQLDSGFQFKTVRIFEPKGLVLPGKYFAFTQLEYDE